MGNLHNIIYLLRKWMQYPLAPLRMLLAYIRRNIGGRDIHAVAKERLLICMTCPHIDVSGDKCIMKGNQPCCGICGCSLALKIYGNMEDCPLHQWKR